MPSVSSDSAHPNSLTKAQLLAAKLRLSTPRSGEGGCHHAKTHPSRRRTFHALDLRPEGWHKDMILQRITRDRQEIRSRDIRQHRLVPPGSSTPVDGERHMMHPEPRSHLRMASFRHAEVVRTAIVGEAGRVVRLPQIEIVRETGAQDEVARERLAEAGDALNGYGRTTGNVRRGARGNALTMPNLWVLFESEFDCSGRASAIERRAVVKHDASAHILREAALGDRALALGLNNDFIGSHQLSVPVQRDIANSLASLLLVRRGDDSGLSPSVRTETARVREAEDES